MEEIAIVYVTCDKYEHVWEEWYKGFTEHWGLDIPVYWCGEEKPCPFDEFEQIPHLRVGPEKWTTKLRAQLEKIPEENIFVWIDDLIPQFSIDVEFQKLYKWFVENGADALRIMGRKSAARYEQGIYIAGRVLNRLTAHSPYLVSYSPNIYKKSFLLRTLEVDESPWAAELKGSQRVRQDTPRRKIYAYHIDGWYINKVVQ